MGGGVVEELDETVQRALSGLVLFSSQGVDGHKHGVINSPSIKEKGTQDFLEAALLARWKDGSVVRGQGELDLFAIGRWCPGVGSVLGLGGIGCSKC